MTHQNTLEFEAFTNHWAACRNCYPRHDRYCPEGKRLHDLNNSSMTYAEVPLVQEEQKRVTPIIPIQRGKRR